MFAAASISSISRFSAKSSSHSGRLSLLLPAASTRLFLGDSSLLREFAGFNEVDESCRGDVEGDLLLEIDDCPGTTKRNEVLSLAKDFLPFFGQMWLLTTGPLMSGNRALRRAYQMTGGQECLRAIAQSRRAEDRVHILVLLRSSALHHWP